MIHEGSAMFTAGEETVEAEPGMIIVVLPNTPHKFTQAPTACARSTSTAAPA